MAFDREKLRRFYLSKGYADFNIESAIAELSPDREGFFLTFTVNEGERYAINKVDIETTLPELDDPSVLLKELTFEEGDWYNADEVENSIQKLTDAVGALGYAFVDIKPRITSYNVCYTKLLRMAGTYDHVIIEVLSQAQ